MNVPSSTSAFSGEAKGASKGMSMVAAYRAARLSQRPVLRSTLQDFYIARRMARSAGQPAVEPDNQLTPEPAPPAEPLTATPPDPREPGSVFANLVSTSVAAELDEAAARETAAAAALKSPEPRSTEGPETAAPAALVQPTASEPVPAPDREPAAAEPAEPAPIAELAQAAVAEAVAPEPVRSPAGANWVRPRHADPAQPVGPAYHG